MTQGLMTAHTFEQQISESKVGRSRHSAKRSVRGNGQTKDKSEYLAERAYQSLLHRIMTGEFRPGAHLKETQLVSLLGVSRSVVRHALIRLTSEGLLLDAPKRGKTVAMFTEDYLAKLLPIRICLEQLAVREAIARLTNKEVEELQRIAIRLKDPMLTLEEQDALDIQFHRTIWVASGNEELQNLLNRVVGPFHLIGNAVWVSPFYRTSKSAISWQKVLLEREGDAGGHQTLAETIARRDTAAACLALEDHLTANYAASPQEFDRRVGELIQKYWHSPKDPSGSSKAKAAK
jgi:DNA-binding GntR family transcriptional regulator